MYPKMKLHVDVEREEAISYSMIRRSVMKQYSLVVNPAR